jgi:predicted exporter
MGFLRGLAQFWYDFLIGDDWKVAVAVVTTLLIGAVILLSLTPPERVFTPVVGVGLMVAFVIALVIDTRKK